MPLTIVVEGGSVTAGGITSFNASDTDCEFKNASFIENVEIGGNLNVNGSTTSVHTDNLVVKDKLIAINASDTQSNSVSNSGIIIYHNSDNTGNVFMGLNNDRIFSVATADGISASITNPTLNDSNLKYDIDLRGNNASFTNISGSGTLDVTSNATIGGTLDVTGTTGIDGDFDINNNKFTVASATGNTAIAGTLDVTGNASFINASFAKISLVKDDVTANSSNDRVLIWDNSDSTSIKTATFAEVCFLKGTKITLPDYSQKNIEDLTLADDVLTYNIESISNIKNKNVLKNVQLDSMNGKISQSGIRNIWINPTDSYLVINDKLKVTKNHIVHFKRDNQYYFRFADHLTIGDELMNDKEVYESVESIEEINEKTNVYNFELDKDNTYFAENYLVHHYCELCSGYSKII